jgi:hypothetical protein
MVTTLVVKCNEKKRPKALVLLKLYTANGAAAAD